jgi:hypothetical protein
MESKQEKKSDKKLDKVKHFISLAVLCYAQRGKSMGKMIV